MEHERLDALARLIAIRGPRRGVLATLVGVALLRCGSGSLADQGKRKRNDRDKRIRERRRKRRRRDNGEDLGDGATCVPSLCPRDPESSAPGRCCPGDWCSCGSECCASSACWVLSREVPSGPGDDTPIRVEEESCAPPAWCITTCPGHEGECCAACPCDEQSGICGCSQNTPISGGSARIRR